MNTSATPSLILFSNDLCRELQESLSDAQQEIQRLLAEIDKMNKRIAALESSGSDKDRRYELGNSVQFHMS